MTAELAMKRQKTLTHEFGISLPAEMVRRIEAVKGDYTRNKFILRAVRRAVQEEEEKLLS
jgi:hypothetical protein